MPFPRRSWIGRQVGPPTPQPGRTADGTVAPPRPQPRALVAGRLARARTLPVAFLAVALLIPLLGLVAVREQYAASRHAAQIEAQHVAEPIAHTVAQSNELTHHDRPDLYLQPDRLQDYLSDIDRDVRRDMVVVGLDRRILADAIPANQGEPFTADPHGEVAATMRDGRPRSFTERSADYPRGILQMVIPLHTDQGKIVGAVLLEYTPIYQELLAASAGTRRLILAASLCGLVLALLVAVLLARGHVADLRRLALAAARLAAGDDHVRAQVRTSGELGKLAVAFNDMAARIAAQTAVLTEVAISDPLTGLHNRRSFQARLAEETQRARRSGSPFALLMIDLDHFKALNDRHGHPAGDAALVVVAGIFRQQLRSVDLPARIGGEEFGVLLPDSDEQAALMAGERLRAAIAACPIVHQDATLTITASIGVAWSGGGADTDEELLRAADRALYAAKRAGRNRVCGHTGLQPAPEWA
jgi:diguanylate cyclase (GGDEF)-like protein